MKLKFKHQAYQADAVRAVVDCFQGQPKSSGLKYAVDPGAASPQSHMPLPGTELEGFANAALVIPPAAILKNLQEIQREQRIPVSEMLMPPLCQDTCPACAVASPSHACCCETLMISAGHSGSPITPITFPSQTTPVPSPPWSVPGSGGR